MPEDGFPGRPEKKALTTWKEVASFLGVAVRTAQLWERARGLPVQRLGSGPKARILADPEELRAWLQDSAGSRTETRPPPPLRRGAPLIAGFLLVVAVLAVFWFIQNSC